MEKPWLEQLLDMTQEIETPRSFIFWGGLVAISAVTQRKLRLRKAGLGYDLLPNIFVLLVADSGLRKTFAVNNLSQPLVETIGNTRVISGINSIQGILKEASKIRSRPNGPPITDSTAALFSGEFSNLLISDPGAMTTLIDLYDTHYNKNYTKTLSSESFTLKNIYFTLLGATNPEHFRDRISDLDIKGGFIARTFIVKESEKSCLNPGIRKGKVEYKLEELVGYLKKVSELTGDFTITEEGIDFFEGWYKNTYSKLHGDKTGFLERVHDHVLKISMLLSLSYRLTLIIEKADIETAISLCEGLASNAKSLTEGSGRSQYSRQTILVLENLLLAPNNRLTRKQLLNKIYADCTSEELDKVLGTLTDMGAITFARIQGDLYYVMDENRVKDYEKYKQQRMAK